MTGRPAPLDPTNRSVILALDETRAIARLEMLTMTELAAMAITDAAWLKGYGITNSPEEVLVCCFELLMQRPQPPLDAQGLHWR